MKRIILEVPDGVMCVGVFINYKTAEQAKDKGNPFTTTNCLIDPSTTTGMRINDDGSLTTLKEEAHETQP